MIVYDVVCVISYSFSLCLSIDIVKDKTIPKQPKPTSLKRSQCAKTHLRRYQTVFIQWC